MPETLVVFAIFPATLGAAYIAQRALLSLVFRAMARTQPH
jgi:hypothetical protein